MVIQLLDYSGKKHSVKIPDNTQELHIQIISGDMVLLSPIYYNTGQNSRTVNFYDGDHFVEKKDFDKLSSLDSAYSLFDL